MSNDPQSSTPHGSDLGSTAHLLDAVRRGDESAISRLVTIYAPLLERWAHGRLPASARGLVETQDLVQVSLIRVLDRIEHFDAERPGSFLAYLRRTVLNQLRNEIRNAGRRPSGPPVTDLEPDPAPSVLEQAVGREALERYEAALAELNEEYQAAIILRFEFGLKHADIADALGSPSPNAARMVVSRAVHQLTRLLGTPEGDR